MRVASECALQFCNAAVPARRSGDVVVCQPVNDNFDRAGEITFWVEIPWVLDQRGMHERDEVWIGCATHTLETTIIG